VDENSVVQSRIPLTDGTTHSISFSLDRPSIETIRLLKSESITIEACDYEATLTCGGRYTFRASPEAVSRLLETANGIPDQQGVKVYVNARQLGQVLQAAECYTSKRGAVLVTLANGALRAASAGQHHRFDATIEGPCPHVSAKLSIPKVYVPYVSTLTPVGSDEIAISQSGEWMYFECPPRMVAIRSSPLPVSRINQQFSHEQPWASFQVDAGSLLDALCILRRACTCNIRSATFEISDSEAILRVPNVLFGYHDSVGPIEFETAVAVTSTQPFSFVINTETVLPFLHRVSGVLTVSAAPRDSASVLFTSASGLRLFTTTVQMR
jgi:hypothetical protein